MQTFVITAIENKNAAIAASDLGAGPQFTFAGNACEPGAAAASYCYSAGDVPAEVRAVFEANPLLYKVSDHAGRQAAAALALHVPELAKFLG